MYPNLDKNQLEKQQFLPLILTRLICRIPETIHTTLIAAMLPFNVEILLYYNARTP